MIVVQAVIRNCPPATFSRRKRGETPRRCFSENSSSMPLPVIRTRRLLLRPWTLEDVDELHALWTMPEVRRYLWDDVVITREMAQQLVDSHLAMAEQAGIGYWALHLTPAPPPGPPMAGFCGFRFIDDGPEIELMYGLEAGRWGKGFATEACVAAIEYLWRSTGFAQVYARTDPPNERSVAVMEQLGMTRHSTSPSTIVYVLRQGRES
jgi:ribosomal-protein-alanine N-acetyltransferase